MQMAKFSDMSADTLHAAIATLEQCKSMWAWLADNPQATKEEYFAAHPSLPKPYNSCWACEFDEVFYCRPVRESGGNIFANDILACHPRCVLTNVWPNGCNKESSPYYVWDKHVRRNSPKITRSAAMDIVKGCDDALAYAKTFLKPEAQHAPV